MKEIRTNDGYEQQARVLVTRARVAEVRASVPDGGNARTITPSAPRSRGKDLRKSCKLERDHRAKEEMTWPSVRLMTETEGEEHHRAVWRAAEAGFFD